MNERYTRTAQALHWLMAALLVGLVSLGLYMHELPLSPRKLQLYSWHKWVGVTVFFLLLVRIGWRITHQPPALPEQMSKLQRITSHVGHTALYLLMIAIPISGWLMSSAKGFQTVWFGVLPIPDLLPKNKELGDLLLELHESLNLLLIALLLAHIAAALKHHFIDKDDVLSRMLPAHSNHSTDASPPEQST